MPVYTYRCQDCQNRFEARLSYDEYGEKKVHCPECKSGKISRLFEGVCVAQSGDSDFSEVNPEKLSDLEDDPRALGRMMRQMREQTGEDLGSEFNEVVSRLEKGQDPEQIGREMPELGNNFDQSKDLEN